MTQSEARFVRDLKKYLEDGGTWFSRFDWWMFSKLDESLDEVRIPYYDAQQNRIRDFKPDFVFWLQKGGQYHVVFVDPKGITIAEYQKPCIQYTAYSILAFRRGRKSRFMRSCIRGMRLASGTTIGGFGSRMWRRCWPRSPDRGSLGGTRHATIFVARLERELGRALRARPIGRPGRKQ